MKSKSFFAMLGVALAMLISFSINDLQAGCGDQGWTGPYYLDAGRIEPCFTIQVTYCMFLEEVNGISKIHTEITNIQLIADSDECDFEAAQEEFNNNYGEYIDKISKAIFADILNTDQELQIIFCENGGYIVHNVSVVLCQTNSLVWVGNKVIGDEFPELYPILEFVPCSEDSKCESLYHLCLYFDISISELVIRQTLIQRNEVVGSECPQSTIVPTYNPMSNFYDDIEYECGTKCD